MTKLYRGKLPTVIEDIHLPNPVIRSPYGNGFIQQDVRDHRMLPTEAATNNLNDDGVKKAVENVSTLPERLNSINDRYLDVQQDILETCVDRGQLRRLAEPTVLENGKRLPGLKLDPPRQRAWMHALVRFAPIAAGNTFTTTPLYPLVLESWGLPPADYKLGSLGYHLSKLLVKALVEKIPHSRRYRLPPQGYSLCVVFLKLFGRIYAPLTAGLLPPALGDSQLQTHTRSQLDRLYQRVTHDLDRLLAAVGLRVAA